MSLSPSLVSSVRLIMGDRADDPPYFVGHHFGGAAFIHAARRDREMTKSSELLRRVVARAESAAGSVGGLQFKTWEAWIRAREGDAAGAMHRLGEIADRTSKPFYDIVRASVLLDGGLHADAKRFIGDSRRFAEWAGINALPPHLDRLEAAGLLATGDTDSALGLLSTARTAFEGLSVPWEVARTDLWLAEAHLMKGDREPAAAAIASARPILEALGSLNEIERARSQLARL